MLCFVDPENRKLPKLRYLLLDFSDDLGIVQVPDMCSSAWSMFFFYLTNIQKLHLYNMSEGIYKRFLATLNGRHFLKLFQLGISLIKGNHSSSNIQTISNVPTTLTDLRLPRFICSLLDITAQSVSKLNKLDISHSSGISGNLSVLLRQSFPSLNSLILSDCGLNSQDLCSLA